MRRLDTPLRRQLALLLVLEAFAAVALGGPLLATGKLVNDRLYDFYFFRDTLHALNVYGEFPWWNPSMWAGFPSYYVNLLYWPGREPLFASLGTAAWILGRLHVAIPSYHAVYVAYFAFLVPCLLSLGVFALARQIFRRALALQFVVVLMAFSPGVVLSIGDLGSEVSAYGFLFAAALLRFVRNPHRSSFLLLVLAALGVATAFTYFALIWTVFFVPVFIAAVCIGPRGVTARARHAFGTIPGAWWAAAVAAVGICAAPTVIAYTHGSDILSATAEGERYYRYEVLRPGTPLEALALSTPGIGFEWTGYGAPDAAFTPRPLGPVSGYSSFGYMGMLTLPLACLGLAVGRVYWRERLLLGIAAWMTIAMLSAYSPVFSLLLAWPSPLRGVGHYSDLTFRLGLFALFALAAGLGLEEVLRSPARRRLLPLLFAGTSALSLAWLIAIQGRAATSNYVFGLAVAFLFLYGIGLTRLAIAASSRESRRAVHVLLVLTLVDTSTLAFAHERLSFARAAGSPVEPSPASIGSVTGHEETDFLHLRGMNDRALLTPPATPATLVSRDTARSAVDGDVSIVRQTYNTVEMRVNAPQPARLEWHDAYFPFWRAWVDGTEVPIARTAENMKSITVPAGMSAVRFRFVPAFLRAAVAASYLVMAGAMVLWLRQRR